MSRIMRVVASICPKLAMHYRLYRDLIANQDSFLYETGKKYRGAETC